MAFKLPWSNFHELNLDWLLEKMKELEEKVNNLVGGATPSTNIPNMDGVGSPGSSITYSRGDHTHPTDTSRASQTYAQSIEGKVDDLEHNCEINFREINDILNFSTAAPIVDGIPNPGTSLYPARADHVHPTDTSRASQTQVDSLQAQIDGFTGSANPSDSTPLMDGTGSAGTGGNYSRGDHVHPHDTSKLDITGGSITGPLSIGGMFNIRNQQKYVTTTAIGWLRVADVPNTPGTRLRFKISRRGSLTPPETHEVSLTILQNTAIFTEEVNTGSVKYVDKIRYTNANKVDIHIDQTAESYVGIYLEKEAARQQDQDTLELVNPYSIGDSPDGETIIATHIFGPAIERRLVKASSNVSFSDAFSAFTAIINDPDITKAGAAADHLATNIGNYSNNIVSLPSGGAVFFGVLGKNSNSYYSAILHSYSVPWHCWVRYVNGTYYAILDYITI